ncbi:MAG: methyl-accepting chemotaxis protein [Leptothrix sp. (in: b-proteobacteria)]
MISDTAPAPAKPSVPALLPRLIARWWRVLGIGLVAMTSVVLATDAALSAWPYAIGSALLCIWLCEAGRQPDAQSGSTASSPEGARLMVREVVPVWQRHLEASRNEAERSVSALLEAFAKLSEVLTGAAESVTQLNPTLGAGATDELIARHDTELQSLLAPMHNALAERDRMLGRLGTVSEALAELTELAKQIASIAKHTNIVALNASIESHRAGQNNGGGFTVVAQEVRTLASRTGDISERIRQRLAILAEQVDDVRRSEELSGCNEEELKLQAQLQARQVISTLLRSMGDSLESSRTLRLASMELRDQIDHVFVSFQFQDRLSQMLGGIRDDMARFTDWMGTNQPATRVEATRWLEALEQTYTMEEQRAHHHGTVEVRRSAGVEFF